MQVSLKACVRIIKDYCQQNGEWYVCELQIATNIIVFPLIQNANLAIILYIYNILPVKNGCGGGKTLFVLDCVRRELNLVFLCRIFPSYNNHNK